MFTYFGCNSLSCTRGSKGGIISLPISLHIMIRAMETTSILELFKSYAHKKSNVLNVFFCFVFLFFFQINLEKSAFAIVHANKIYFIKFIYLFMNDENTNAQ